jgi:hypothetical protein
MGSIIGVALVGRLLWELGQLAHLPLFLAVVAFGAWVAVASTYLVRRARARAPWRPRFARLRNARARS